MKKSSKAQGRPWRQHQPVQLPAGEAGTSPEPWARASTASWSSKAGLHWCLNKLGTEFLLGRAFAAPARPCTVLDVHRWREGGSSQLQLFQGRISYKFIIQFPSYYSQGIIPREKPPGWMLNLGQGQQMGVPMGRYNSGQCSQQLLAVQPS